MFVNNNTNEWVVDEMFEDIRIRVKLFKKFNKSRLHTESKLQESKKKTSNDD